MKKRYNQVFDTTEQTELTYIMPDFGEQEIELPLMLGGGGYLKERMRRHWRILNVAPRKNKN